MTPEEVACKAECENIVMQLFRIIDHHPRSDEGHAVAAKLCVDEARPMMEGIMGGFRKEFAPIHLITNLHVTPTGPETAEGFCYNVAFNMWTDTDEPNFRATPFLPNRIGTIECTFRKTADGWRISRFGSSTRIIDDGTEIGR